MRKLSFGLNAALLCLILCLAACKGSAAPGLQEIAPTPEPQSVALRISSTWAGSHGTVVIEVEQAADLHQLALRLAYDPAVAEPTEVQQGTLVDERAVFFSTVAAEAYVPVAFTYHLGEELPAATGSIAVIQFTRSDPNVIPGFSIISDTEYLIARDRNAVPITLSLGGDS